ncbi:MAG TPA: hypothetical protein GX711_01635 [Clostridia bacterium]|nr:hypothetical protein [Clostridia bacterium]
MARGFWKGVMTGGLLGGFISSLLASPAKKSRDRGQPDVQDRTRRIKVKAQRAMEEVKDGVKEMWKK